MMLNTNRLVLREFVADDWHAVLAYQSDSRYLQYYPWTERTAQEVQAFVQRFISWQAEEPRIRFQLATHRYVRHPYGGGRRTEGGSGIRDCAIALGPGLRDRGISRHARPRFRGTGTAPCLGILPGRERGLGPGVGETGHAV